MKRLRWIVPALLIVAAPRPADAQILQRVCDSAQRYWCFEVLDVNAPTSFVAQYDDVTHWYFSWTVTGYWWGSAFSGIRQVDWWGTVRHATSGGSAGVRYTSTSQNLTGRAEPGVPSTLYGESGSELWNWQQYGKSFSLSPHVFDEITWSDPNSSAGGSCVASRTTAAGCHYVMVAEPASLRLVLTGLLSLGFLGWCSRESPYLGGSLSHPYSSPS